MKKLLFTSLVVAVSLNAANLAQEAKDAGLLCQKPKRKSMPFSRQTA